MSEYIHTDRIRTAPSVNASGQALARAAHFDTAFVVETSLYTNLKEEYQVIFSFTANINLNLIFFCP